MPWKVSDSDGHVVWIVQNCEMFSVSTTLPQISGKVVDKVVMQSVVSLQRMREMIWQSSKGLRGLMSFGRESGACLRCKSLMSNCCHQPALHDISYIPFCTTATTITQAQPVSLLSLPGYVCSIAYHIRRKLLSTVNHVLLVGHWLRTTICFVATKQSTTLQMVASERVSRIDCVVFSQTKIGIDQRVGKMFFGM